MNKFLFDGEADECQNVAFCSFSHCSNLAFRLFYTKLIQLNSRLGTPIFNGQFDSFVPSKTHIFSKISPLNVTGSDNLYNGHFSVS